LEQTGFKTTVDGVEVRAGVIAVAVAAMVDFSGGDREESEGETDSVGDGEAEEVGVVEGDMVELTDPIGVIDVLGMREIEGDNDAGRDSEGVTQFDIVTLCKSSIQSAKMEDITWYVIA